jgi:hypothetical protein
METGHKDKGASLKRSPSCQIMDNLTIKLNNGSKGFNTLHKLGIHEAKLTHINELSRRKTSSLW